MATVNNITGDALISKLGNKEQQEKFNNNFDAIFGKKEKKTNGGYVPPPLPVDTSWDDDRVDIIGQNGNTGEHYEATSKPTK